MYSQAIGAYTEPSTSRHASIDRRLRTAQWATSRNLARCLIGDRFWRLLLTPHPSTALALICANGRV